MGNLNHKEVMMDEIYRDKDLTLEWGFFGHDLKVLHGEVVLYNSLTGFVHEALSHRQVQWITDHYNKKRNNYVFQSENS